jgi:site-specific recombinase XerD
MKKDIQQLFNEFIYESEYVRRVRPDTLRGYKQAFEIFIKITPSASPDNLTTHLMSQFFKTLQERKRIVGKGEIRTGIKNSTAATYWSKLNTFFSWLLIRKVISENPFRLMAYPTPQYDDLKFLKKAEIEKILTAIHIHHNRKALLFKRNLVLFYLLLFCGLRREEVLLLQVRDIDFDNKTVEIRGETSKSGKGRKLPLHSTTLMHLKDYLKERKTYTTPFLLVSGTRDDRLSIEGLAHLIKRIRKYSGVRFHPHQFRHTFAVNFLKTSNNIAKLKQLMGHKDIRMTMTYLRCLPVDEMRGDVENMNIDCLI